MFKDMTPNLMVENVNRAAGFYVDVLGFTVAASMPPTADEWEFAILVKEGITLMLQEKESLIEEYPSLATPKIQPSITLFFNVSNFDEFYAEVCAKHAITVEPHVTSYGTQEFALADRDGYILTFAKKDE